MAKMRVLQQSSFLTLSIPYLIFSLLKLAFASPITTTITIDDPKVLQKLVRRTAVEPEGSVQKTYYFGTLEGDKVTTVGVVDDVFPPCDVNDESLPTASLNIVCHSTVTRTYDPKAGIAIFELGLGGNYTIFPTAGEQIVIRPRYFPDYDRSHWFTPEELANKCGALEVMEKVPEEAIPDMLGCKPSEWSTAEPKVASHVLKVMEAHVIGTVTTTAAEEEEMPTATPTPEPETESELTLPTPFPTYSPPAPPYGNITLPRTDSTIIATPPGPQPSHPRPNETNSSGARTTVTGTGTGTWPVTPSNPHNIMTTFTEDEGFMTNVMTLDGDRFYTTTISGKIYVIHVGAISFVNYKVPATRWIARDSSGGSEKPANAISVSDKDDGNAGLGLKPTAIAGLPNPGTSEMWDVIEEVIDRPLPHGGSFIKDPAPGIEKNEPIVIGPGGGSGETPGDDGFPSTLPLVDFVDGADEPFPWPDLVYDDDINNGGDASQEDKAGAPRKETAIPPRRPQSPNTPSPQPPTSTSLTPTPTRSKPTLPRPVASLISTSFQSRTELPSPSKIAVQLSRLPPTDRTNISTWILDQIGLVSGDRRRSLPSGEETGMPGAEFNNIATPEEAAARKEVAAWLSSTLKILASESIPSTINDDNPSPPKPRNLHPPPSISISISNLPPALRKSIHDFLARTSGTLSNQKIRITPEIIHTLRILDPGIVEDEEMVGIAVRSLLEDGRFVRAMGGRYRNVEREKKVEGKGAEGDGVVVAEVTVGAKKKSGAVRGRGVGMVVLGGWVVGVVGLVTVIV